MGSYSPTFEILYSKLLNDELVEGLLSIVGHMYPSLYTRIRRIERLRFFWLLEKRKNAVFDQV